MSGTEGWHRRHAIQLAAQLPEDPKDALIVLELARGLVETFLADQPRPALAEVVDFPSALRAS